MHLGTTERDGCHVGASTFIAASHPSESCGKNGLPLTPNSTRVLGMAQALLSVSHPNLCTYIDFVKSKSGKRHAAQLNPGSSGGSRLDVVECGFTQNASLESL